jgi:hypothetical protein
VRALARAKPPVSAHIETVLELTDLPRALLDERQTNLKLIILQKQVRQLRRNGKKIEQTKTSTQELATKSLDAYARASCRQLCDEIHNTFPREVRDMIYSHLHCHGHKPVRVSTWWRDSLALCEWDLDPEPEWGATPELHIQRKHWWDCEFVGHLLQRESSEHFYRSHLFFFEDKFDLLPKFRVTDHFNLGFVPADVITNVGVRIDCAGYDFDGLQPVPQPTRNAGSWDDSQYTPRDLCSLLLLRLEHLFGFKKGTKISISLFVDRDKKIGTPLEVQQWLCDTAVAFLLPSIQRLVSSRYLLRLILTGWYTYDTYTGEADFIYESKTFEQDTIQSTFASVSICFLTLVSNTHSNSSILSSWRRRHSSWRRMTTSPMSKIALKRTRAKTQTATMDEHVRYDFVPFTNVTNSNKEQE